MKNIRNFPGLFPPFQAITLIAVLCAAMTVPIGVGAAQQITATPSPVPISAIVYQTTNLREGPDTRFEILGRLAQDDEVRVFERDSDPARWLHVITETGTSGWIPVFTIEPVEGHTLDEVPIYAAAIPNPNSAAPSNVTVHAYGRVNIRSGPAIQYEIVGTLDLDDEAAVTARSNTLNDWLYIETDEVQGWVAYFTVTVEGDPNTLPVRVPDSEGDELISPTRVLRARFNIRLHTDPTIESPTLVVVAFNSRVTLLARTDDGLWLYVDYDGLAGWGAADLFSTPPDLASIPVYTPGIEITPEAMPEATAEATS